MSIKKYFKADAFWEYVLGSVPKIRTDCAVEVSNDFLLGSQNGVTAANELDLILLVHGANYYQVSGSTAIQKISNVEITGGTEIKLLLPSTVAVEHGVASNGNYKTINLSGAANYASGKKRMLTLVYDSADAKWYETARTDLA